jgi:hypothetical protein
MREMTRCNLEILRARMSVADTVAGRFQFLLRRRRISVRAVLLSAPLSEHTCSLRRLYKLTANSVGGIGSESECQPPARESELEHHCFQTLIVIAANFVAELGAAVVRLAANLGQRIPRVNPSGTRAVALNNLVLRL